MPRRSPKARQQSLQLLFFSAFKKRSNYKYFEVRDLVLSRKAIRHIDPKILPKGAATRMNTSSVVQNTVSRSVSDKRCHAGTMDVDHTHTYHNPEQYPIRWHSRVGMYATSRTCRTFFSTDTGWTTKSSTAVFNDNCDQLRTNE